ncbi:MAG: ankyrin repeat domain-containing protein [Candidatus Avelusimicrobium sp.]|uniref:ankyrin repeat domain-containing protein n=1 Tax=Candidatus Avelusimicrobium sp. TaxID=3048833 RepID=UPI003EFE31BE
MEFLLMKVVDTGNLEQLKRLIKAGVDLSVSDELDRSPLMLACYKGHLPVVSYLAENDAYQNLWKKEQVDALMWASIGGQVPVLQYLLKTGINVDAIDDENMTALMYACQENQFEAVTFLVAAGADVNAGFWNKRCDWVSGLYLANLYGWQDIADFLRQKGAW